MKELIKQNNDKDFILHLLFSVLFVFLIFHFSLLALMLMPFISVLYKKAIFHHITAIFLIFFYSLLIINRDVYASVGVAGYGDDVLHYLRSFYELQDASFSDVFKIALFNTSSADLFFWPFAYEISNIFNPNQTWLFLTFFTLGLLYIAFARINSKAALCILFCYLCTITFYTLQGSALRQSLAFSLFCMFLSLIYTSEKNVKQIFIMLLTVLSHGSGLLAFIIYTSSKIDIFDKIHKNWFKAISIILLVVMVVIFIGLFIPADYYLLVKIISRLQSSNEEQNMIWFYQFIVETSFVFTILYIVKNKTNINKRLLQMHLVFIVIILLLLPLSEIAYRLYRFNYIFFAFYFLELIKYSNGKNRVFICYLSMATSIFWWSSLFATRYGGVYFGTDLMGLLNLNMVDFLDVFESGLNTL